MISVYHRFLFALAAGLILAAPGSASVTTYVLSNHIDGNAIPPPYGFRLDGLLSAAKYTFDFEYDDGNEVAEMKLDFDDIAMTVHIYGRAYGGKDIGTEYDATEQGWADIDFTYTLNVIMADNAAGDPGNDLYVTAENAANSGTITLDGWGGDITCTLADKFSSSEGNSFRFDNDFDPRDAASEANPMIVSAAGWVYLNGSDPSGAQDWLFNAEREAPTAVEEISWAQVKNLYR